MPTMAKLVAAAAYAAVAFYVSLFVVEIFAEQMALPNLALWNAALGAWMGWSIAGSRAGQGLYGAFGYGVTTTFATALSCVFAHSFAEMIRRAMRMQYDGPADAVISVLQLMWDNTLRIATPEVLASTAIGGLAAAFVTEIVAWRTS